MRAMPGDGADPIPAAIHAQVLFLHLSVCLSCLPQCLLQSANHGHFSLILQIQIFWVSAIWTKAPVLPGTLHRLEWKKNKNIPWSWVKAARLPQPLSCRQGAALAPLQPPAKIEPAGKIIN